MVGLGFPWSGSNRGGSYILPGPGVLSRTAVAIAVCSPLEKADNSQSPVVKASSFIPSSQWSPLARGQAATPRAEGDRRLNPASGF